MIPKPSVADPQIPFTHAAALTKCVPESRLFQFMVKWPKWGEGGIGYMPYEYFDRYMFECWALYLHSNMLRLYKLQKLDAEGRVRWSAHDELDDRIYAFEVRDPQYDDRRAWAFAVERDGGLEVEELYVRPEFRRLGHGRWLADRVAQLGREKKLPLRFWIGFADCKSENASNYAALVATARRLGVKFQICPTRWAAYFATSEQPGAESPIEPNVVPDRPRAPLNAVRAFVLSLSLVQPQYNANNAALVDEQGLANVRAKAVSADPGTTVEVGTAQWQAMNKRRYDLNVKKVDGVITPEEQEELKQLEFPIDGDSQ